MYGQEHIVFDYDSTERCYLDRPRLHFAGRFRANVATINNNYDNFSPDFQPVNEVINDDETAGYGGWNPGGTNEFLFHDVTVTMMCPKQGDCIKPDLMELQYNPMMITTDSGEGSTQITDIDVEWQLSSILYGMKVAINPKKSAMSTSAWHGLDAIVSGSFYPVGTTGYWDSTTGTEWMSRSSARYQSVLENLEWNDELLNSVDRNTHQYKYSLLRELREASPHRLSMSFVVYGYSFLPGTPDATYGYVVGTIGPSTGSRNLNYIRGRLLGSVHAQMPSAVTLNRAQFILREQTKTLTFDFSNSLPKVYDNVTSQYLINTKSIGYQLCITSHHREIARVNLSNEWYNDEAGIQEVFLTDIMLANVKVDLLQVVSCSNVRHVYLNESLQYVRPQSDSLIFMDPGDTVNLNVFVNQFGKPVKNKKLTLVVHIHHPCHDLYGHTRLHCNKTTNNQLKRALGELQVNGHTQTTVTTNSSGQATIQLSAGDPGNVRRIVDGLVYLISYMPVGSEGPVTYQDTFIAIRLFDLFTPQGEPTWYGTNGVHTILKQYDNLYPAMRRVLNIGDYHTVVGIQRNIDYLKCTLSVPRTDPKHMPGTRDLSRNKRDMILKWLHQSYPPKKGERMPMTITELREQLQLAIQLEFYTIPIYLYAFCSLKEDFNQEIRSIIQSVVTEEMMHFSLAANVLNAVGGHPLIDRPERMPVYPSRLPGGIQPDLTMRIAPFSIDLVRNVFMAIETPHSLTDPATRERYNDTIGGFYHQISENLVHLEKEQQLKNKTIFTGDPALQVEYSLPGHITVFKVNNMAQALEAIRAIVTEGEGSSQTNPTDNYHDLAHYYRFAEIVHGRELIKTSKNSWDYTGECEFCV